MSDAGTSGWATVPLGSLLMDMQAGFASGKHNTVGEGVPHLRPMNVSADGRVDRTSLKYVDPAAGRPDLRLRRGDVLFNNTNSPELVGKTALFDDDDSPAFSNHMTRLRVDPTRLDPAFLALRLHHAWREGWFAEHCNNHVSQSSVGRDVLRVFPLELPPLDVQRAIARLTDALGQRRASAEHHLAAARGAIERFRKAVLTVACCGRLTEDWREVHPEASAIGLVELLAERRRLLVGPRAKPPSPIASQDLPSIPTSWRWASVDFVAWRVVDGVHKTPTYRESGIPFVTVRNLTSGPELTVEGTRFISEEDHVQLCKRAKPERGDLLISKDGTIGVTRAIRTDQPFSIFVSVALVKPVLQTMTDYLEIALSSSPVQEQMIGVGSGLQHLVLRDLKADGVPIPPLEEQTEIVRRASSLLAAADRLAHSIYRAGRRLERSQSALLAKALRGALRVNDSVIQSDSVEAST